MHLELDPADFIPNCYMYHYVPRRTETSSVKCVLSYCFVMLIAVVLSAGGVYYYKNVYLLLEEFNDAPEYSQSDVEGCKSFGPQINILKTQMNTLKEKLEDVYDWKLKFEQSLLKLKAGQLNMLNGFEEALDTYDADKIGILDYAASYAGGSVISTPGTNPYPLNRSVSFFNLVKVDIFSSPEAILQPATLPGQCFAFYGSSGRIRIKLSHRTRIRSVTMEHANIKLLNDGYDSAPKKFSVYGFYNDHDETGVFLGRFLFNATGRPRQNFPINRNLTYTEFGAVELHVLDNYGKSEYTCVYRFRVHDAIARSFVETGRVGKGGCACHG